VFLKPWNIRSVGNLCRRFQNFRKNSQFLQRRQRRYPLRTDIGCGCRGFPIGVPSEFVTLTALAVKLRAIVLDRSIYRSSCHCRGSLGSDAMAAVKAAIALPP
jgi:hypothetical protein